MRCETPRASAQAAETLRTKRFMAVLNDKVWTSITQRRVRRLCIQGNFVGLIVNTFWFHFGDHFAVPGSTFGEAEIMRAGPIFSVLAVLLGLMARASAADKFEDPNKEQDFRARLIQCGICHGAKGRPKPSNFPVIWGQQQNYLIKQMRALPGAAGRVPAVALTALARAEDRKRALSAGYQKHVSKPVDPAELVAVIASLVGRQALATRSS